MRRYLRKASTRPNINKQNLLAKYRPNPLLRFAIPCLCGPLSSPLSLAGLPFFFRHTPFPVNFLPRPPSSPKGNFLA